MTRAMTMTSWIGAALIAVVAGGCSDAAQRDAKEAARDTGNAVERAADRTAEAGRDAGHAIGAAMETADVKLALTTDSRVDASDINVDTDHNTKTVTLKGHVPTAQQKEVAEEIAKAKAPEYKVHNELMVR